MFPIVFSKDSVKENKEKQEEKYLLKYFPKDICNVISSYLPPFILLEKTISDVISDSNKVDFYILPLDNITSLFDTDKNVKDVLNTNFFIAVRRNKNIMINSDESLKIWKDIQLFEEEIELHNYMVTKDISLLNNMLFLLSSLRRQKKPYKLQYYQIFCNFNTYVLM